MSLSVGGRGQTVSSSETEREESGEKSERATKKTKKKKDKGQKHNQCWAVLQSSNTAIKDIIGESEHIDNEERITG